MVMQSRKNYLFDLVRGGVGSKKNNSGTRTIKASHDSLQAELNVLIQHGDKRTKKLKKVLLIQEELKMAENKKWKLSSEKIVEDTMFRYGMKLNEERCTFYERNSSPLERDMLENCWRLSLALGESRARLQALKKKDRNLDKRKEMGRRNDGTICERNGRCKFRLVEAAKKFEENSTKWLKESFKTPKIMHDMLVQLMSVVKNDDRAKKLQTVGWLHFGLYAQTLEMDCANGYVCRLIRWELRKVGKGLGPGWDC
ncbi:hypothetical protein RhiirA1_441616 [Rhizophagus irregularis]|uniref:Uncharacterized protein n=2 Tax=Rhizophagus irregularis TaxID=588596 RepID=A0A2I1EX14_9GLOM|nr:hypothetical protein RhiirA1_441616 [Rhizophagus irregularis]PKY26656.1 hypothetical protein RhiirB3_473148 [Rhizophagus irregularis]